MSQHSAPDRLGLICGSGTLPFAVAESAAARGRTVILYAIRGFADPAQVVRWPHHWVALGEVGRLTRLLRQEKCADVVLIGGLVRPALRNVRVDFGTLRVMPRILRAFRGGDDHLLRTLGTIFEDRGFRVVGLQDIAPQVLTPPGALTSHAPDAQASADIALGLGLLEAIGPFDIGQAAVVIDGHVVAIEGAEGTDGLLQRVGAMRASGRITAPAGRGVLVKAPKPGQDLRFDLPTIGPRTVAGAHEAQLAGIAVSAGQSLLAESQATITEADRARMFVVGIASGAVGAARA